MSKTIDDVYFNWDDLTLEQFKAELLELVKQAAPKQKNAFAEQMYPNKHKEDNLRKYGYNQALQDYLTAIEGLFGGGDEM